MSSNLRPINFTNVELEAARRKTAAKRADELKKLEDNYDKAENQAKLQSDERVKEIRDDNQTKLIMEMGDKEEKLLKLKQSYDQTRDLIDMEKQNTLFYKRYRLFSPKDFLFYFELKMDTTYHKKDVLNVMNKSLDQMNKNKKVFQDNQKEVKH
jgi:hypothetical protein